MQPLFEDGDEQVNRDGAPDLGAHRVLARKGEKGSNHSLDAIGIEQAVLPACRAS